MRILITGANGMIGRELARQAVVKGWPITAAILPETSQQGLEGCRIERSSHPDSPAMVALLREQDLVINLVGNMHGNRRHVYQTANVDYPRRLTEALAKLVKPPRLLHLSSVAAIGPSSDGTPLSETQPCRPIGIYGITKRQGEIEVLRQAADKVPVLILRPPSIYGPEDRCFLELFQWADQGFFPRLCTRTKRFNLLFRDDLVRLLLDLATRDWPREAVLHAGSPVMHTDEDLANALGRAAGKTLRRVFVPRGLLRLAAMVTRFQEALGWPPPLLSKSKVAEMSQSFWVHDFSRFHHHFGPPSTLGLNDGIARTTTWYKQKKWL